MLNDLLKDDDKKMIEPFNIVGRRSLIYSREEAAKIINDNSYYIFVAAVINFAASVYLFVIPTNVGISEDYLLLAGIFYFAMGVGVRKFKSRVASLLALGSFGYALLMQVLEKSMSGFYLFTFIFCLASYRLVKASSYYHKVRKVCTTNK
jgi:hypothetical protein